MNAPRVLLMQLSERTSAKGNRYLAGWLGKASVVAFQAEEPDKFGNPVWEVFVSEPQPRSEQRPLPLERAEQRPQGPAPGDVTANRSARPLRGGDGYRGPSRYVRPRDARRAGLLPEDSELAEDDLADIGRR